MNPDPAACDRCIEQVDDYVAAQLAGRAYTTLFPEVAEHLDACVECAAAYARLYELETEAGSLPRPEEMPEPDLSFLPGEALTTILARSVQQQGERLHLHLQLRLSEALLALLAAPAPLTATRSRDRLRYELSPEQAAEAGLPLHLHVYEEGQRPGMGVVEITVAPPGESWPDLGGKMVTLAYADTRRRETTDAWGVALFRDVPLASLGTATVIVADS